MTPTEIIQYAKTDGVILTLLSPGTIRAIGNQSAVNKWLPTIRTNKTGILCELQREYRLTKVLALLLEGERFALFVDDDKTDPVIAAVGIRDLVAFELVIPRHSYNNMVLSELIKKQYGGNYASN